MSINRNIVITAFVIFLANSSATILAQEEDSTALKSFVHRLEMNVTPQYVFKTQVIKDEENQPNKQYKNAFSASLKYSFEFAPNTYFGKHYPHTYQGIGVAYNTFFESNELGTPLSVYVFQGSRIAKLSSSLSLDYEWNFGASFFWHPYNVYSNPENIVIGSRVNAYINIGFYLNWQMSRDWLFTAGINASHYSNGNTKSPNNGLNTLGLRVGVSRLFYSGCSEKTASHNYWMQPTEEPRIGLDVVAYGATRSKGITETNTMIPGSFGVAGINVNPMYRINKFFRTGLSLDWQYDESANMENNIAGTDSNGDVKFYRSSFSDCMSLGFSIRGEFVMPIFSINFGIGHNVHYKGEDAKGLYEVLVLKTYITKRLFVHTGYQIRDFHYPKNLMMGIGYTFK